MMKHRSSILAGVIVSCLAWTATANTGDGTFSIVAFDTATQELGVAVQSRAFSVGGGVPWVEAGVGAIATQASTNESYGPRGLALLRAGYSAEEALRMLLGTDAEREHRQVGIVDARGGAAAHTGVECLSWAGDSTAARLSVQGNILAGPEVVAAMVNAFYETHGELAERLIAALHAGQAAGGDKRGQQSAALIVARPSDAYPEYRTRYIDLRVEDHPRPIDELERVFRIHQSSDLLRAHLRYAEHFDSLGALEDAERERRRIGEALERTLDDENADAGTLNALAWYCATSDMYLEASLEAARRARELQPEDTAILDTLAEVLYRLGRSKEALKVIGRAIRLDPDDDYLKRQRARFKGPQRQR